MKKALKHRLKDNKGVYTLYGIYDNISEGLNASVCSLSDCGKRVVSYNQFTKVIMLYFKFLMLDLLNGKKVDLYNRFGELRLAKRKVDKFVPKTFKFVLVDEVKIREEVDTLEIMKKNNWFWYYLNWNVFKKWRTHEFKQAKRFKDEMMKKVDRGFDYIDYTPLYKGEGTIRKIK